jgi:ferredoxin-nitrite reductase
VSDAFATTCERALQSAGFFTEPHTTAGCVIACTGNKGCKYASADTKGNARELMTFLRRSKVQTDLPVNIHLTGCPNSCAQHYCGDIGGVAAKLADGRERYHVVLGGGMDQEQGLAREVFRGVGAEELPGVVENILATYLNKRAAGETFVQWSRRHNLKQLQELLSE